MTKKRGLKLVGGAAHRFAEVCIKSGCLWCSPRGDCILRCVCCGKAWNEDPTAEIYKRPCRECVTQKFIADKCKFEVEHRVCRC